MIDFTGADERSRTLDLLITNELLYQLSYIGPAQAQAKPMIIHGRGVLCRAPDRVLS